MKKIELAKGYFAFLDDDDYEKLSKYCWYLGGNGHGGLYVARKTQGTTIYMHREILGSPDSLIDHINRNGLDNRKSNLRLCTRSQNLYNRCKTVKNKCGYKGVRKIYKGWQANIWLNGKQIYLGHYSTAKDAAIAYNEAAKKYHGEFALLNEI
jgi:hypothetical protein